VDGKNRVLVGWPERVEKRNQVIMQYQNREQVLILLTTQLRLGIIDQAEYLDTLEHLLAEPITVVDTTDGS
jgi:hypothetical protein